MMNRDFPDGKWFRRMALVSLCGVSIMSDYSDRVWFREMMQLMTLMMIMVLMI
jgi:hypothetical protein